MSDKYLVWSSEHRCWWRADRAGYTRKVELAGRYDRSDAISISRGRGWPATGIPDEVPVLEKDAIECFAAAGPLSYRDDPRPAKQIIEEDNWPDRSAAQGEQE